MLLHPSPIGSESNGAGQASFRWRSQEGLGEVGVTRQLLLRADFDELLRSRAAVDLI